MRQLLTNSGTTFGIQVTTVNYMRHRVGNKTIYPILVEVFCTVCVLWWAVKLERWRWLGAWESLLYWVTNRKHHESEDDVGNTAPTFLHVTLFSVLQALSFPLEPQVNFIFISLYYYWVHIGERKADNLEGEEYSVLSIFVGYNAYFYSKKLYLSGRLGGSVS